MGGLAYHVLNRAVGRSTLFRKPADYEAFERILAEAWERVGTRILGYCVLPNHWHMILWPREDDELSEFMRWLTVTHAQRWHAHHHTAGTGPIYQGRFKSFPIQQDDHLLTRRAANRDLRELAGAPETAHLHPDGSRKQRVECLGFTLYVVDLDHGAERRRIFRQLGRTKCGDASYG